MEKEFRLAQFCHKELWGKLGTLSIPIDERKYKKEDQYDNVVLRYGVNLANWDSSCFACDLLHTLSIQNSTQLYCQYCPINWGESKSCVLPRSSECESKKDSLYVQYLKALPKEAKKIAIQIRDLPWIFEKVKKGLLIKENGKTSSKKRLLK